MGHTNQTANYDLPQFVGTDKPSWLGDINDAFNAIDLAIAAAASEASTADGKADALTTTVSGHTTQIGTLQNTVTTQGNTLNTVTSLIGNGTPTTTDQTIIGGINEINGHLTANGQRLIFSYDEISHEYGFTVDGQFYPLAGSTPVSTKWDAVSDQNLLVPMAKSTFQAPTVVTGSGSFKIKTAGDGTAQNGIVWVNEAKAESTQVTLAGTLSGIQGGTGCTVYKSTTKTGDNTGLTQLADLTNGAVSQTFNLNANEYIGIFMANNALPNVEVELTVTTLREV